MNLQAFRSELLKIADLTQPSPTRPAPSKAIVKGPAIPHPGGLKPPPLPTAAQGGSMWDAISAGMRGTKGAPNPMVGILKNAAPTSSGIMPKATTVAKTIGARAFPKPSAVPSMSNINPWEVQHMASSATPASMTAATVPPPARRLQMATANTQFAPPSAKVAAMRDELQKIGAGFTLSNEARSNLPKKDFAVSPKKSNTGKEAYPIPDRRHAGIALGFSKMHGDSADYAAVRAKVKAKYPDMLEAHDKRHEMKKAASVAESAGKAIGGKAGDFIAKHHNAFDLGGLGVLSAAPAAGVAHQVHNAATGKKVDKGELARDGLEVGGLGTLAAPGIVQALRGAAHAA